MTPIERTGRRRRRRYVPHMIQSCTCDRGKILFSDPCLPMILQDWERDVEVLVLAKGVFVDNVVVSSVFEYAGCYPRLEGDQR